MLAEGGSGRKLSNEDEVTEFLVKQGFQIYATDSLSQSEQASLFNSASVIVSVHGAALSNIIFCKNGTWVIEIFNSVIPTCYKGIAEISGLNYMPVSVSGEDCIDSSARSDFRVDIKLIEKGLSRVKL